MTSTGGLTGLWIIALVAVLGANLGESTKYPLKEPHVPFPPACPTEHNIAAVCHHGHLRPRYPEEFFPASGASHFRRRGKAINRLEFWFTWCCSGEAARNVSAILCCTQQAWKQALSMFCVDEYSTKTAPYICCKVLGDTRWDCFNSEPTNPSYKPTKREMAPQMKPELGFIFTPNDC